MADIIVTRHILISILIYMPLTLLFIDTVSGFILLTNVAQVSISVFYKFVFVFICIISVFLFGNKSSQIHILLLFIFSCLYLLFLNFFGRTEFVVYYGVEVFKLFSTFFIYYGISTLPSFSYLKIKKFYTVTLCVLLLNVLISFLGFGYNSYGEYGYKGFIYGGNALSGIIVILSVYFMGICVNKVKITGFYLFFVFLSYLVGTKSAILGVSLAYTLIMISNFEIRFAIYYIVLFFILSVAAIAALDFFKSTPMFERLNYFYESGGLGFLLFSGRLDFLDKLWLVFSNSGLDSIIFGINPSLRYSLEQSISEMDFTDIIFTFGVLTLCVYLISLIYIIHSIISTTNNNLTKLATICSGVLFIIGCLAGHVLFNGVITPYWGVVLALPILLDKHLRENCENSNINI